MRGLLAILCGFGILQECINDTVGFFAPPSCNHAQEAKKESTNDDTWHCSYCDHTNYTWTSICGKCGRSR